jgi:hypothetical protein
VQQRAVDCMNCIAGYKAHDSHQQTTSNSGQNKVVPNHEQETVKTKSLAVSLNLKFWKRQAQGFSMEPKAWGEWSYGSEEEKQY